MGILLAPRSLSAQCTVGSLGQFSPPGPSTGYGPNAKFKSGFATSLAPFTYQGQRKLLMRENYGYTIYDLSSPGTPGAPVFCDIEAFYHKSGDSFNTVYGVGASPDGNRILVAYEGPHGNLAMGRGAAVAPGCTFNFGGEYPPSRAAGEAVAVLEGATPRYLGFSMSGIGTVGLFVSDVTALLSGSAAQVPGSLAYENVQGTPPGLRSLRVAGTYAVYNSTSSVVVVDFANAGPAGAIGFGLVTRVFTATQLGFPASDQISSVAAAIHPVDGHLYLMVEASTSLQVPDGFGLFRLQGSSLVPVGSLFFPPSPWSGASASSPGVSAAAATGADIFFFAWAHESAPSANKLFTFSTGTWGTDLTPNAIYLSANYPASCATNPTSCQFNTTSAAQAVFTGGNQLYLYTTTAEAAYALPLACGPPVPTAVVSGGGTICPGQQATVQAALTGTPPWSLTWSDGAVQSGITTSPATRNVGPPSTTVYAIRAVSDPNGAGSSTGSATVTTDVAPPVVTPPADLVVDQTLCCDSFGGVTPASSPALAAFLTGATASDNCTASPRALPPASGGLTISSTTCFPAGATLVGFSFQDETGNLGSASAVVTVRMYGDLNLDLAIDAADLVLLRSYLNLSISPGVPPFVAPGSLADLNHDTTVDAADLVLLRGYLNLAVACLAP